MFCIIGSTHISSPHSSAAIKAIHKCDRSITKPAVTTAIQTVMHVLSHFVKRVRNVSTHAETRRGATSCDGPTTSRLVERCEMDFRSPFIILWPSDMWSERRSHGSTDPQWTNRVKPGRGAGSVSGNVCNVVVNVQSKAAWAVNFNKIRSVTDSLGGNLSPVADDVPIHARREEGYFDYFSTASPQLSADMWT